MFWKIARHIGAIALRLISNHVAQSDSARQSPRRVAKVTDDLAAESGRGTLRDRVDHAAHDGLANFPKNAAAIFALLLQKLFENIDKLVRRPDERAAAAIKVSIILVMFGVGGIFAYSYAAESLEPVISVGRRVSCAAVSAFCEESVLGEWSYQANGADGSSWGGVMQIMRVEGKYPNTFKATGLRKWVKDRDGKLTCAKSKWDSDPSAYIEDDILYHYDLKFSPVKGFVRLSAQDAVPHKKFAGEFYESDAGKLVEGNIEISRTLSDKCQNVSDGD